LLTNILDPNANSAPSYEEYMIQATDGRLITGRDGQPERYRSHLAAQKK